MEIGTNYVYFHMSLTSLTVIDGIFRTGLELGRWQCGSWLCRVQVQVTGQPCGREARVCRGRGRRPAVVTTRTSHQQRQQRRHQDQRQLQCLLLPHQRKWQQFWVLYVIYVLFLSPCYYSDPLCVCVYEDWVSKERSDKVWIVVFKTWLTSLFTGSFTILFPRKIITTV